MSSDPYVTTLLEAGIAAAKTGQRDEARHFLLQVVEQDEENVLGWLWLCGLVDDIEERQICLENVLALDPDNETARKALALLQQQQGAAQPAPPPLPSAPPRSSSAPAPPKNAAPAYARASSAQQPRYKRLRAPAVTATVPFSEVAEPEPPADPLENEYGCPYCLAPTQPNDRSCPRCAKSLWLHVPRRPKPSALFKILFWLQILNTVQYFLGIGGLIVSMTGLIMNAATIPQMEGLEGFNVTAATLPLILFITIPIGIYNVALVFGLYKRWRPVYYLYLLNSVLTLGAAATVLFLMGWGALCCGAPLALFGIAQFFLILNLGEDFTSDKYRILLRADRDLKTGQEFMTRAHRYGDRKMWGMAALHFRRAGYLLTNNLDCRLGLVVSLTNSKQYDPAAKALADAKLINSTDPRIEKLEDLLAQSRPG